MDEQIQIQLFIEGKLSGEELGKFKEKIENDKAFSEQVEDYKVIYKGLKSLRDESFQNKVRSWNESLPEVPINKKNFFVLNSVVRKIAVAIVFLIIGIGTSYWWMQKNAWQKFEQAKYIRPVLDVDRGGRSDGVSSTYDLAEIDFASVADGKTDYTACINRLKTITPKDSLYLKALYLSGHAHYKSGNYNIAKQEFEKLIKAYNTTNKNWINTVNLDNAKWIAILCDHELCKKSEVNKEALIIRINNFLKEQPEETYGRKAKTLLNLL